MALTPSRNKICINNNLVTSSGVCSVHAIINIILRCGIDPPQNVYKQQFGNRFWSVQYAR